MKGILSIDSPLWMILNKITDVIILSLLFIVTSIPIFTIGASISALYEIMFRIADDTEGHMVQGYFRAFKENFKKITFVWLLILFTGMVLAGDIYICIAFNVPFAKFLLAVVSVVAILLVMVLTYFFPMFVKCTGDKKQILFMAFMMSIKEWWRTLFMLFITVIMVCVGLFVMAPFLLIAPGVIALSHVYIFREIFEKYNMKAEENVAEIE